MNRVLLRTKNLIKTNGNKNFFTKRSTVNFLFPQTSNFKKISNKNFSNFDDEDYNDAYSYKDGDRYKSSNVKKI